MEYLQHPQDSMERPVAEDIIASSSPLPNHIEKNIDTIAVLKTKAEQDVAHPQRMIEKIADLFGHPTFFFSLFTVVGIWITFNLLPGRWNIPRFDPPPFDWLEKLISLGSLLMTVGVLVRQSRQEKLVEQQKELSLQLNLLTEQKVAKLIALIEELRKDLPNVKNRSDLEAEIMQESVNPHQVIDALEERLAQEIDQVQSLDT